MRFVSLFLLLTVSLLQACAPFRQVEGPIAQVQEVLSCGKPAKHLVLLLPGLFDQPADFVAEGFVQAVRSRQLDVDLTLLDAHIGYYNERQIVDRLRREVVAPARARGYQSIWLVGISLGGFGSLLYSQAHPQDVTGFLAIAPFLGDKGLLREIEEAGGVGPWRPTGDPSRLGEEAWRLAQGYLAGDSGLPQGHLGYGVSDRFAPANALFAQVLLPSHRYTAPGGHDWPAWNQVWAQFLDSGVFGQTKRVPQPC